MSKQEVIKKIQNNVTQWHKQLELSDYLKEKLSGCDKLTNKAHIEVIVDNIIERCKLEEDPRWTTLLFNNIKSLPKENKTEINVFADIASKTNEGIEKLVGSSNTQKKSIKDII